MSKINCLRVINLGLAQVGVPPACQSPSLTIGVPLPFLSPPLHLCSALSHLRCRTKHFQDCAQSGGRERGGSQECLLCCTSAQRFITLLWWSTAQATLKSEVSLWRAWTGAGSQSSRRPQAGSWRERRNMAGNCARVSHLAGKAGLEKSVLCLSLGLFSPQADGLGNLEN